MAKYGISHEGSPSWLMFAKLHLSIPEFFLNNTFWRDETKSQKCGHNANNYVW